MEKELLQSLVLTTASFSNQSLRLKGYEKAVVQKVDPRYMWLKLEANPQELNKTQIEMKLKMDGYIQITDFMKENKNQNDYCVMVAYDHNKEKKLMKLSKDITPCLIKGFYMIKASSENYLNELIQVNKLQQISDIESLSKI